MVVLEKGTTKKDIRFYDLSTIGDFAHDYKDNTERCTEFNKIADIVQELFNNMTGGYGGTDIAYHNYDARPLSLQEKLEQLEQLEQAKNIEQMLELYVRPIFDKLFYELKFYYYAFSYDDNTVTFGNPVNKEHFLEHFSDKNPKNYLYNNFLRILVEKFEKDENYALMESFTTEELETLWVEINEQHGGNDDFPYIILPPVNTTVLTGIKGKAFQNKTGHITIKKISNNKFTVGVPKGSGFDSHQGTHSSSGKAGTAKDIVTFMQETFADDGKNGPRANAIKAFNAWYPKAVVPGVSASSDTTPSKKRSADSPVTPPSKKSAIASDVTNKNFVDIILKFFVEKVFKIDVKEDNEEDLMLRSQKFAIKNILDNKAMTSVDETILRGVENVVSFNATEMVQDDTKPGIRRIGGDGGEEETQLRDDIENTRVNTGGCAMYVIDNAGSANHGFQDARVICPLSQVMDGITDMTEHICKPQFHIDDYKIENENHTLSKNTSPGTEYGNMLVHLKHDDKNSVELSRIFKPADTPASLDLKIVFKNDGNKFESTMSIVKSKKDDVHHDAWYTNTITVDNKEYVNDYIIVYNDMGSYMTIKAANVYRNATFLLTDIYKDLPADKEERRIKLIACAYGCLVFKSFGDIMQEWNGVLKGGGYVKDETGVYQAPTYKQDENICKHTAENSEPLRVMLTGDRPSGARVLWSLYKGKEQDGWGNYINSNCFGGYAAQPGMNLKGEKTTDEEKIYIPVHNYFLFNPSFDKVYTFKTGNTILRPNGNDANKEIKKEIKDDRSLVGIPKNTRDWNSTYHPIVEVLLGIKREPKTTTKPIPAAVSNPSDKYCTEFTYNGSKYMLQLINKKLSDTTIWRITASDGSFKEGTKSSFGNFGIDEKEKAFSEARLELHINAKAKTGYVYSGTDYCMPGSPSGSPSGNVLGNASNSMDIDINRITWIGDFTQRPYNDFIRAATRRNGGSGGLSGWNLSSTEFNRFKKIAFEYSENGKRVLTVQDQKNIINEFNNPSKDELNTADTASSSKRSRQQQPTERTFTLEQIKDALSSVAGTAAYNTEKIKFKNQFNDNKTTMTLQEIKNINLSSDVDKDAFIKNLTTPKRIRYSKQRAGGAQRAQTAQTIQQETTPDPLIYSIGAILAFGAMMIGLQR